MKSYSFFIVLFVLVASCTSLKETTNAEEPIEEDIVLLPEIEVVPVIKEYKPSEIKVNDLLHTRLDVRFDWDNQYLLGKAELEFKPYFYPTNRVILDAKGFDLHTVKLITDSGYVDLNYSYDSLFIDIELDRKYSRFEKYKIKIDYTAKPNELKEGGSAAITSDKGLYFINPDSTEVNKPTQIWTQGETEASSCWFPTIDTPNERMTQEIFITVDKKYKSLSNGEHVYSNYNADDTRTDCWKMDKPHPPYLVMMAIGDFMTGRDTWENSKGEIIPVNYFIEADYADYVFNIFGNTPEMLSFYSEILNYDYPWEKFSQVIVRDYVSGAMENTSAVIHGEFLNSTDRELLDYDNEDVIAHELFHHWFGDLVTCESWANLPLNESFATYGEYLWFEHKYGLDEANYHSYQSMMGYLSESRYKKVNLIRYDYDFRDDMFDAHSYNKGGRILHMLRKIVGDDAFFLSLNKYLVDNEYQGAEVHNLRLAFEEISGYDLNWFFNQWFLNSGHPELEVSYDFDSISSEQIVTVKQTQDLDLAPIFQLPIKVALWNGEKNQVHELFIKEKEEAFRIAVSQKADWVNFDVDKAMLGKIDDNKPKTWWISQFDNAQNLMDRHEPLSHAILSADSLYDQVIFKALQDPYWRIRELALDGVRLIKDRMPEVELILNQMVGDEKSLVRAKALEVLGIEFPQGGYEQLFVNALEDRSYAVIGAGLGQLANYNTNKAMQEAEKLEDERPSSILLTIAQLYSEHGDESKNSFFESKYASIGSYEKYTFVQFYGNYLLRQDEQTVQKGIVLLEDVARNAQPWWVKLSAYQAMGSLATSYDTLAENKQKELELERSMDSSSPKIKELEDIIQSVSAASQMIKLKIQEIHSEEKDEQVLQSIQ